MEERMDMSGYAGKKFVASFSGGKDSTLALHRAICCGMKPCRLITTWNTDMGRSWFHGLPGPVLESLSTAWGIPVALIRTTGPAYADSFENHLRMEKEKGAEICLFGDIDLEPHRQWCTARCEAAGLEACFPLWQENRKALVHEFLDAGYRAIITVVDTSVMDASFLGRELNRQEVDAIEACGADACGENGEYHTFVFAGPLMAGIVPFRTGDVIRQDHYAIMPVTSVECETRE
jgi:diphthine-ammonia ligase